MTALPKPEKAPPKPRKRIARSRPRKRRRGRVAEEQRECDRLAGLICRAKKYCEACNRSYPNVVLQWAHGFSRRYHSVRWDERNSFCLCQPCHYKYTLDPLAWDAWMREKMGNEMYEQVRLMAQARGWKYDSVILFALRRRAEELGLEI